MTMVATPKYSALLEKLKAFEEEHNEWLQQVWHQQNDFSMKNYMEGVVRNNHELQYLIENGTNEDVSTFYEELKEAVPALSIPLLKSMLDMCHSTERLQSPFSKDLVKWFRKMGWKFPPFEFEKIETAAAESVASH